MVVQWALWGMHVHSLLGEQVPSAHTGHHCQRGKAGAASSVDGSRPAPYLSFLTLYPQPQLWGIQKSDPLTSGWDEFHLGLNNIPQYV